MSIVLRNPMIVGRDERGCAQFRCSLSSWLGIAEPAYDAETLADVERKLLAGETARIDMNLGRWLDLEVAT
jgi:hypothetical protein